MKLEKKEDFFGYVYDIFCEFAKKKPEQVDLTFSRKINHPEVKRFSEVSFVMPMPRFKNGLFYFEGLEFEDTPPQRATLWAIFLASLYHLASHAAISQYSVYQKWTKNKTAEISNGVIDFIEDSMIEKYLKSSNPLMWKNLSEINSKIDNFENEISEKGKNYQLTIPPACSIQDENILAKIRETITQIENGPNYERQILEIADLLYQNRQLLSKIVLPCCRHVNDKNTNSTERCTVDFDLDDEFKEITYRLDELWAINEQTRIRLLRQHQKHLKGLHFDSIMLSPENYHEFVQIREKIFPMIRRIRQQIRMIVNVTDSPKTDQMGYVDMQMAIQAIASKGNVSEVFEQDEDRRAEEAWIILIDKSASMRLRFDHIKEFAVCVAEAANELTGKHDSWAMYSFDNNFQIIKDFRERYSQEIQARLGGLQNSGLSLLPDAIELSYRILAADPREKKFLFVITDGHPSGYDRIQEQFSKIAKKVEISGVIMVAIGVSKAASKKFRNNARGTDLKQLVAKFITAYRTASSDM